jgi:hypothetical protein
MVTEVIAATVVNWRLNSDRVLDHQIGAGQMRSPKISLRKAAKSGQLAGCGDPLGNDARNHFVALPEFHSLAGSQPRFQALGIAKLADVYAGHSKIVPQIVTHVKASDVYES